MTTPQPTPRTVAHSWLSVGVRALDGHTGRTGVVQLLQDDLGAVRTEVIDHPTRVLLRPVGGGEPAWWAAVADLRQADPR
ncbi:hypothetical protein [Streptomyces oceani]|nr:hypothetical protein [Streptomyces oceani]